MNPAARPRSLRGRLALGYAGIALVTALLLGAILAVALPRFFAQFEQGYLRDATADALRRLDETGGAGFGDAQALQRQVVLIAEANQLRVRVTDPSGRTLADSGPPADAAAVSPEVRVEPIPDRGGRAIGQIEVSGGPKVGAGLTSSIAWAWAIAGTIAVAVSAGLGFVLAGRVSEPLTQLTRVSGEMARGDLSVRADPRGVVEVRTLATAFNEMADGIEHTFKSLRRFVDDAAHEIGTPLTALQADLELARESPSDPSVPALLEQSLGHAERIGALTRNLLTLSRLEALGAVAEPQSVELTALVSAALDGVASRAEQADIELVFDDRGGGLAVAGDPAALDRALANLLDNALKFTPAGGKVSVSLAQSDALAVLRVCDTGRGISPADVPHVFERFRRARDTAAVPGSGLGLAIVKAIVDAHRGRVRLWSDAHGTTVEMRLPIARLGFGTAIPL